MVTEAMERLEKNIVGSLWDEQDCADVKVLIASLRNDWRFVVILNGIVHHHDAHPDHGIDCACMDKYIQQLLILTKVFTVPQQRRVDYVLRKVVDR